jgi:hypothetical protein
MAETIDSETPSIVIRQKTSPSSKRSTPKTRASFQEPLPSSPTHRSDDPWVSLGMTVEEWKQHRMRVQRYLAAWHREDQLEAEAEDCSTARFWEQRLQVLEMLREKYNKKAAWSSDVQREVEKLDEAIAECEYEMNALYDEQDRLEYMYD